MSSKVERSFEPLRFAPSDANDLQTMAFNNWPKQERGIELLQRSLERGRLAHAYLFTGHDLTPLEGVARTLAKTLNCQRPVKKNGTPIDCCDQCLTCQKID